MFPRDSILIDKSTGKQFRVLATPDQARILTSYQGLTRKAPCYGLQPIDPEGKVFYIEQPRVEEEYQARDGCPP